MFFLPIYVYKYMGCIFNPSERWSMHKMISSSIRKYLYISFWRRIMFTIIFFVFPLTLILTAKGSTTKYGIDVRKEYSMASYFFIINTLENLIPFFIVFSSYPSVILLDQPASTPASYRFLIDIGVTQTKTKKYSTRVKLPATNAFIGFIILNHPDACVKGDPICPIS